MDHRILNIVQSALTTQYLIKVLPINKSEKRKQMTGREVWTGLDESTARDREKERERER